MAKSKAQLSDEQQVIKDEATAETAYQQTLDGRVAAVYDQPEPGVEPPSPTQVWLTEANEAQAVIVKGDAISPDVLKALLARAIGLLTPTV